MESACANYARLSIAAAASSATDDLRRQLEQHSVKMPQGSKRLLGDAAKLRLAQHDIWAATNRQLTDVQQDMCLRFVDVSGGKVDSGLKEEQVTALKAALGAHTVTWSAPLKLATVLATPESAVIGMTPDERSQAIMRRELAWRTWSDDELTKALPGFVVLFDSAVFMGAQKNVESIYARSGVKLPTTICTSRPL
jgi:hypothetical protein